MSANIQPMSEEDLAHHFWERVVGNVPPQSAQKYFNTERFIRLLPQLVDMASFSKFLEIFRAINRNP